MLLKLASDFPVFEIRCYGTAVVIKLKIKENYYDIFAILMPLKDLKTYSRDVSQPGKAKSAT
jgi:hypothetical protein